MGFYSFLLPIIAAVTVVRGNPQLLFANRKDIRMFDIGGNGKSASVVARNLDDAAAVDFLYNEGFIFWTDINLEKIMRTVVHQHPAASANSIITTGLVSPDGLACDWLGRKLYWTDAETNRIEVSNLDGSHRKVLYWQNLDQPRAIALDPFHGYMFWTDWGESPKIERAGMDGSQNTRAVIVDDNIYWPNGLTLDYEESKIYWADAKLNYIHSCNFDGRFRKVIVDESLPHPFALTLFRDTLFWTDWQTKSIHSCNKDTGIENPEVLRDIESPMDIHVYAPERQPAGVNPCGSNNGGCSHLCLMSPFRPNYTCACPTGVRLLQDGKNCADGAEQMLLLARRTDIRRISLDTPDFTDVVLPLDGIKHAIAIDYDPVDGYVYWTDDEARVIRRALLNGSDSQTLIKTEVDHPDGIAIDWVARNMYWTDTGTDRIEVARLNGSSRKVIISEHLDEPRAICLYPEEGYMWWTDWGHEPKIERAFLDGTNREAIIDKGLEWPNGIAVDFKERKLYWGDARLDKIEVANFDGTGRRALVKDDLPHLFGFSELGDYLYWTDWQRRSIERLSKQPGGERSLIIEQLPDMMGLKAVNVKRGEGSNACGINNGGCSHLCLFTPKGPQCACPMGLELISMGKKCIVPEAFLLFTTEADIKRMSLSSQHRVVPIPLKGIKKAQAIDFDIGGNKIYWTDLSLQSISRAFMNGSATETIIEFGVNSPEGMAVDWVAHNIYWVDSDTNRIEVARLDGSSRRVLVWQNLSHPRALALDPPNGHMYWADWSEPPKLERAHLDGSNREVIVEDIGRVYGLTIDYIAQRLYWADVDREIIESCELDGNNRTIVTRDVQRPMALTQYEGQLYWSDWASKTIEKANKTDGAMQTVIQMDVDNVMDIAVYHHSRQSGWNGCVGNNGGCSNLCLALPDKFDTNHTRKCACPTHYSLNPDNRTCSAPKSFLLFSQKNEIRRLVVSDKSVSAEPDMVLPLKGLSKLEALDFDPTTGFVYWIVGGGTGKSKPAGSKPKPVMIKRAKLDGTLPEVIVSEPASSTMLFDLVIDPYAQTLFWSCSKKNVINFTRIDAKVGGVVVEMENKMPRYLAINPHKGYLYWTNAGSPASIQRCLYDGTEMISLFHSGISKPGPITVDPSTNKLYWADLDSQVIESSDPTGGNRQLLYSGKQGATLKTVNGIAVFGNFLYWVDRDEKLIGRINKNSGGQITIVQGRVPNLSDIHAAIYIQPEVVKAHPCARNNGNCSHICIAKTDHHAQCTCPNNLVLKKDERTCAEKSTCSPDEFTCLTGQKECIPYEWKCDGTPECADKSDELDCPICDSLREFQCEDKKCIKTEQVCDGKKQCSDGGDEQACCDNPQQKKCLEDDKCFDKSSQCDGVKDCDDGSDEVGCNVPQVKESTAQSLSAHVTVAIVVGVFAIAVLFAIVFACRRKSTDTQFDDHDMMSLTRPLYPSETSTTSETQKNNTGSGRGKKHDRIKATITTTSVPVASDSTTAYDRTKLTGASSSSSAVTQYPKETLNPPPSPVTDRSICAGEFVDCTSNSPSTNRSHKRRRRHHTRPPPTTPCSTDVCEESEPYFATRNYNNYMAELNYDSDPFPPPPTPRSHYFSDEMMSGPDSPRTERSYFNPLPPPPSPVANSDC